MLVGHASLVAANSDVWTIHVLMLVKLSEEKVLDFFSSCVKGQPAFVVRVDHPRAVYARCMNPVLDSFDVLARWCKHVVDIIRGPILAIVWRFRV